MSSVAEFRQCHAELRARRPGQVLVVAHRGTRAGVIAENTVQSAELALLSGADVVEVDATVTRDGVALAHHDGTERVNLGLDSNAAHWSFDEVAAHPHLASAFAGEPMRLARLEDVVSVVRDRDALVHIDRAWQWWVPVLDTLDKLRMPERVVLKAPARPELWRDVVAHPCAYPAIAIVRSWAEVDAMLALDGLNLVGVEFIASSAEHELAQPSAFERAHDRGLSVVVNAENLDGGPPLFAGWDDHSSVFGSFGSGWARLRELGADDIQTDVPWLLDRFLRAGRDLAG